MQVFYTSRYYAELVEPSPATLEDVLLVHTEDYISPFVQRQVDSERIRRLGLP